MDTLDRFLLREFLIYFILILFGLALLFLGVDFLSKFWGMNQPVAKALIIYLYKLPAALQQFVPVACLMSTLLVLTTMSRQNEILALFSCGISVLRIASTFVAVTATLSTFAFLTFDTWVPTFARKELLVSRGLDPGQEELLSSRGQGFWYRSGNVVYNIGRFGNDKHRIENLRLYRLSDDFKIVETIRADFAIFENNEWQVKKGIRTFYPLDSPYPRQESFSNMLGVIPEKPDDLGTIKVEENTMRLRELRRHIERNRTYGFDTTGQEVSYHERLALVFAPLVFVLLALPFAMKPLKTQSIAKSVGFCFFVVFLYLLTFRLSISVGKGGNIPPIVAGWFPNVAFLAFTGFKLLKR